MVLAYPDTIKSGEMNLRYNDYPASQTVFLFQGLVNVQYTYINDDVPNILMKSALFATGEETGLCKSFAQCFPISYGVIRECDY